MLCVGTGEGNVVSKDVCPIRKVQIFLMVIYDVLTSDIQILF